MRHGGGPFANQEGAGLTYRALLREPDGVVQLLLPLGPYMYADQGPLQLLLGDLPDGSNNILGHKILRSHRLRYLPRRKSASYILNGPAPTPAMSQLQDERWAFVVEWFDASADLVRQYQLLYYLMDSTLEMVRDRTARLWVFVLPSAPGGVPLGGARGRS